MDAKISPLAPRLPADLDAHSNSFGVKIAVRSGGTFPELLPGHTHFDYEGVALDHDERPRLQRDLGQKNLMLLHNHGTLAVGKNCADAFLRMYLLERACTMQVRTRMLGDVSMDHPTDEAVIEKNAELTRAGGLSSLADSLVWPALLRKLDRMGSDLRN